jgi:hypothetical protein
LPGNDWRRQNPRFEADNLQHDRRLLEAIEPIARSLGCTRAQLALAWLLHQAEDIVPIPGTRHIARLDENAAATRRHCPSKRYSVSMPHSTGDSSRDALPGCGHGQCESLISSPVRAGRSRCRRRNS